MESIYNRQEICYCHYVRGEKKKVSRQVTDLKQHDESISEKCQASKLIFYVLKAVQINVCKKNITKAVSMLASKVIKTYRSLKCIVTYMQLNIHLLIEFKEIIFRQRNQIS